MQRGLLISSLMPMGRSAVEVDGAGRNAGRKGGSLTSPVTDINEARSAASFAQRYLRLGWHVLPLDPGTKKPLGRLVRNGFHDATNDAETASRWWAQAPDAGIGIALRKSGLVAVDIDPRNGGIDTIDQLEAIHGPIVSDVLALTGGGGEHRVFSAQLVDGLPGTLGPGVDLKADGYIAVEPTLHPSGKRYGWDAESDPLDGIVPSTLPSWIRNLGRTQSAITPTSMPAPSIDPRRAQDAREALQEIPSDSRDDWVKVGAAIHNEMPTQEGFSLWDAWSQTSAKYDPQDQMRVWRSFQRKGLAGLGLNTVFAMAQKMGWKNTGAVVTAEAVQAPQSKSPAIQLLDLSQLDEASKHVSWCVKHVLPADAIGVMFGAPGTFKSFIALDLALHVAHGLPWLGRKTKQGPVIYIAAEGGTGLMRRVRAWHQARGLDWVGIPFYVIPAAVMLSTRSSDVVEAAKSVGVVPSLVAVDTKSQTDEGEENSSTDTARYFRELGTWFRALWACSVLVLHHSGHSATERPRGSSAIVGNVDFMFGVFRDEKEMLATMVCERQKDGELFEEVSFSLTSCTLGHDEDDEAITSLSAQHINNAQALIEAHEREALAGRGGRFQAFCGLLQTGITEKQLRQAFYGLLPGMQMDAKKKAFYDQRTKALREGIFEFGTVIGSTEKVVIVRNGQS